MKAHVTHPATKSSDAPKVDKPTSMLAAPGSSTETIHSAEQPPLSEYGRPEWRSLQDGYLYQHCVWPHPTGKTHKGLIQNQGVFGEPDFVHTGLYWEGNEEEWFANFRKE